STDRKGKGRVPGPFTMGRQAQDDYYRDEEAAATAYADALNAEIKDLFAAGADIVQIDEPWMQQHPDKARRYGIKALNRALDGVAGTVAVHLCFGYAACATSRRAIPSCRNWSSPKRSRFRSKRRSQNSTSRSSPNCPPRPSCSA